VIAQISPAQLDAWFHAQPAGSAPLVLDVRESWEIEAASVRPEGFELAAIPMMDVPARIAELDPQRPLAVLCHHGARSQRVAAFLETKGFLRLANIAGGIEAWSTERDPAVPHY